MPKPPRLIDVLDNRPNIIDHYIMQRRVSTAPRRIGAHSLHHLELWKRPTQEFDEMMVGLETFMLAEQLADESRTFQFKWPASAFQRFKLRHRRLKRFLPKVKYMHGQGTVRVKSWANFPECNTVYPENFGMPIRFQEIEQTQLEPWL